MRAITTHQLGGLNEALTIHASDTVTPGGAPTEYVLGWPQVNPYNQQETVTMHCAIPFQSRPLAQGGVDGVSNEALLAIVRDRLEQFQAGPFPCPENHEALAGLLVAMGALRRRTQDRLARGVEGTEQP